MIRDVAALLQALQQKEMEVIARSGISHAPTIGAQYEGLTSSLLEWMIPANLSLQVVTGFVEGVDATLSQQIDCMLVKGSGTPVPHVHNAFKWPVRDVLAVFEVKKTLFGDDLTDAHDQFQSVMDKFWVYAESLTPEDNVDVTAADYVYGQLFGELPPDGSNDFDQLPFHKQVIYRLLMDEQVAPVRVVFGYYGYQNEFTLREGFLNFLLRNRQKQGFAGIALPTLIVCGRNSLIKGNGHPYYFPLNGDKMLCFASSSQDPLLLILNILLTRISYHYPAPDWYHRDLSMEGFAPLLWGKPIEEEHLVGWAYEEVPLSQQRLESAQELSTDDWRPITITALQATILAIIGNRGIARDRLLQEFADERPESILSEVADLIQKRLVSWKADRLVFLTHQCATVLTGRGEFVAGDMEDRRFSEWLKRNSHRTAPTREGPHRLAEVEPHL